ncbi:MAG: PAS domain S-box protein, partial [Candidatus Lokiarchaeota archaeon]|nr:PAS domain S-box protein [Candidatus Lokiarchaeota archaeon]
MDKREIFRIFAERAGVSFALSDIEGNLLYLNSAACDLLNVESLNGMNDKNIYSYNPKFNEEQTKNNVMKTLKKKDNWIGEMPIIDSKGNKIDTIQNIFIIRDANNAAKYLGNIITDISETKKLKKQIMTSYKEKSRLQNILQTSPTIVITWKNEPNWPVIFVSENIRKFGYKPEDFYQNKILYENIIHQDDKERILDEVELYTMKQSLSRYIQNYRIVTGSGNIKWISDHTFIEKDDDGKIKYFHGILTDITELKKAQEKIDHQKNQLLSIFEAINHSIYVSDPNTYKVLYVNKYLEQMLGHNPVGKICYEEFQGLQKPCDFCTNSIILNQKYKPYNWEYYNKKLEKHFLLNDQIIKWTDNRDVRLEFAIDITQQKEIERSLRESEQKFRMLSEQALIAIMILQDGKVKYANRTLSKLIDYSVEEILNWEKDQFTNYIHPKDLNFASKQAEIKQKGIKKGVVNHYKFRILNRRDEIRWVEIYSKSIMYKSKPANFITMLDITDKIRNEKERKKSEIQYQSLFANMPVGVAYYQVTTDSDNNPDNLIFLDVNSTFEKITGLERKNVIGRSIKEIDTIFSPDLERWMTKFSEVIKNNEKFSVEEYFKEINKSYLISAYSPLSNYFITIFNDISEIKLAEKRLSEEKETLDVTLKSIGDAVISADNQGCVVLINKIAEDLIGYSYSQVIGKSIDKILELYREDTKERIVNISDW